MEQYVNYLPQFKGFGIADAEMEKMAKSLLVLKPEDYERLGCAVPKDDAPIVGLLLGREDGHYCSDEDLVKALASAGLRVLFMNYSNHLRQLSKCAALVLPGGCFNTPEWYYTDAKVADQGKYPNQRCRAYIECFKFAMAIGMPVLGICAGMQVMAAECGLKLYRSQDYVETPLHHQTQERLAHYIDLLPNKPFSVMMGVQWRLPVNSRHSELLAPVRVQQEELGIKNLPLNIYALATDGVPEAVGKMEKGLLGVQWHPENYAAHGDEMQQRIFNWLVEKARNFQ